MTFFAKEEPQQGEKTLSAICDPLIEECHFKTPEDESMRYYSSKDGIYKEGAKRVVEQIVRQQINHNITKHEMNEILYYIENLTFVPLSEFDKYPEWQHVGNGWININSSEFKEHSPDMLSLRKLPVEYKPDASCPEIFKFLESTLDDESMAIILRMIAYCLLNYSKYEVAFILVGEGANGKSTLIKLIKAFIGPDNCSAVSLQDIAADKFAKAELAGKMVNLFADLKSTKVKDGDFKPIVSGDRIQVQRKYGQPFTLENTAKLIFATNNIPETEDDSYAYFRRWVIVPFNRTFEGDNKDVNILERITTPEELSGLLNWSLIILRQLIREGGVEHSDIAEVKKQYQLGASRIQDFINDCCILGQDQSVRTVDLSNALANYCKSKGTKYLDIRELGKKLADIGIEHKQRKIKGQQSWWYFGIGLKKTVTESQTDLLLPCIDANNIVEGSNDEITVTTVTPTKQEGELN